MEDVRKRNVNQQKTSQSPKNKLDPARNENQPKKRYTPFLHANLQLRGRLFPESVVLNSIQIAITYLFSPSDHNAQV